MLESFITIMLVVLLTKHVDKISFANRSKVIVVVEPIFLAQVMQRYSNHSLSNDTMYSVVQDEHVSMTLKHLVSFYSCH